MRTEEKITIFGEALTVLLPCGYDSFVKWASRVYGHCQWCNCTLNDSCPPTRDHLIPRSKGGSNRLDNIVLACKSCNNLRKNNLCSNTRRFYGPRWKNAPTGLFVPEGEPIRGICILWYWEDGRLWRNLYTGSWKQCHAIKKRMRSVHNNGVKRNWMVVPTGALIAANLREKLLREMVKVVVRKPPTPEEWRERVSVRAYYKWEAAGRPHGASDHFWFEAERELKEEK